jgi:hypothetical protein
MKQIAQAFSVFVFGCQIREPLDEHRSRFTA